MPPFILIHQNVAPFTGAWIETIFFPPARLGGLVAPFTGAWIETGRKMLLFNRASRRSLHGSVD